jgi:hypothetical protein
MWIAGGITARFRWAPVVSVAAVWGNRIAVLCPSFWPEEIVSLGSVHSRWVELDLGTEMARAAAVISLLRFFINLMLGKRSSGRCCRCGLAQVWRRRAPVLSWCCWPRPLLGLRQVFPSFSSRPSAALWLWADGCELVYATMLWCCHTVVYF